MSEMPAQTENRRVWILDTIRENQAITAELLLAADANEFETCAMLLGSLYTMERDALLQDEGIFTREQRRFIYDKSESK